MLDVLEPHRVWCHDFTHFTRARRVAIAVMDVVSRRWLSTLVSAEETSSQIEAAFLAALDEEQLADRIDTRLLAALRAGTATVAKLDGPEADGVPVLIAMSDNGPQMRSHSTKEFMAACAIMQRFGRPGTPTDQAWGMQATRRAGPVILQIIAVSRSTQGGGTAGTVVVRRRQSRPVFVSTA